MNYNQINTQAVKAARRVEVVNIVLERRMLYILRQPPYNLGLRNSALSRELRRAAAVAHLGVGHTGRRPACQSARIGTPPAALPARSGLLAWKTDTDTDTHTDNE